MQVFILLEQRCYILWTVCQITELLGVTGPNVLKTTTDPGVNVQDASEPGSRNIFAQLCPSVNLAHLAAGHAPASWSMMHRNQPDVGLIPGVNICPKLGRVLLTGADFPSTLTHAHAPKTQPKVATIHGAEPARVRSSGVPTQRVCSRQHV